MSKDRLNQPVYRNSFETVRAIEGTVLDTGHSHYASVL